MTDGDRPYLVVMAVVLAISGVMLAAPVDRLLESRERVQLLERKQALLDEEIRRLEARAADLRDREHIELLAREQLGLVKPGEVPYVVVTPEDERPQVGPGERPPPPDTRPWYRRLWEAITGS